MLRRIRVAVYGTLKEGQGNHDILTEYGNPKLLKKTELSGYTMFDLGPFPALTYGNGRAHVEIYELDAGILPLLDRVEGYRGDHAGSLYVRRQFEDEELGEVYIYIFNKQLNAQAVEHIVADGNWKGTENEK